MNKALALAVVMLVALTIGFAMNQPSTFLGPRVVATANLTNQTNSIPTTMIFRPPVNGVYRASVYMSQITPGNGTNVMLDWTDNAGEEIALVGNTQNSPAPPTAYCTSGSNTLPCGTTFFAKAGTPVSYWTQATGGTYDLFIVIERLE
jgi:hypothetical protein